MRLRWRTLLLGFALAIGAPAAVAEMPQILLADVYRGQVDVSKYLVSEKLDGVRAVWDGETLRFRSGKAISAPRWFVEALPARPLDGELWLGRGTFERLSGVVRRDIPVDAEWRQVLYVIFELPGAPGPFVERAAAIRELTARLNLPWLQAVEQRPAVDRKKLQKLMRDVVAGGGEGLMLHRADAPYESGRSQTLLKVKPWNDAEAIVVGHLPGKGRYAGKLGALRVRDATGLEFSLGTGFSDRQRENPPPVGATVTYRYRDLTGQGRPRFASFLRLREE